MRRATRGQTNYIRTLAQHVGERTAREISKNLLKDQVTGKPVDVFERAPNQPHVFSRELILDHIHKTDATKLIDALKAAKNRRR